MDNSACVRIFVAGERSGSGKSSTCVALLDALLARGYRPAELGYIKPATQCESPQLIGAYCAAKGIACVGVGPVVFYKGFTRAFLAGDFGSPPSAAAAALLASAASAVDALAAGRKVVLVDGVGYAAVGSICGVSNAAVAAAARASVLVMGKPGVGDAVDAFNLTASFFRTQGAGLAVRGAIFNRLQLGGYYALPKCAEAVGLYFGQLAEVMAAEQQQQQQQQQQQRGGGSAGGAGGAGGGAAAAVVVPSLYGFVPESADLAAATATWKARVDELLAAEAGAAASAASSSAGGAAAASGPEQAAAAQAAHAVPLCDAELALLQPFLASFRERVDCAKLFGDFGCGSSGSGGGGGGGDGCSAGRLAASAASARPLLMDGGGWFQEVRKRAAAGVAAGAASRAAALPVAAAVSGEGGGAGGGRSGTTRKSFVLAVDGDMSGGGGTMPLPKRSRFEIEQGAKGQGASGG